MVGTMCAVVYMHNENHTLITISISGDLSQNYDCYVGMATVLWFICISYTCRVNNILDDADEM